jgi:hypothetical protein
MDLRVLTIDPGVSGGYVVTRVTGTYKAHERIEPFRSMQNVAFHAKHYGATMAVIEEVHASPVMSPSSAFSFGQSYGQYLGALAALGIPTYGVRPQQWQKDIVPPSVKGAQRKKELYKYARTLRDLPDVTLKTCDALILAEWVANILMTRGLDAAGLKKIL